MSGFFVLILIFGFSISFRRFVGFLSLFASIPFLAVFFIIARKEALWRENHSAGASAIPIEPLTRHLTSSSGSLHAIFPHHLTFPAQYCWNVAIQSNVGVRFSHTTSLAVSSDASLDSPELSCLEFFFLPTPFLPGLTLTLTSFSDLPLPSSICTYAKSALTFAFSDLKSLITRTFAIIVLTYT